MTSIINGEDGLSVRRKLNSLLSVGTNLQSGTSYTLQATDEHVLVAFTNNSPVTVSVPADLGAGFSCSIAQLGTGTVTVVGAGTTVNAAGGVNSLSGQFGVAGLCAYDDDVFLLVTGGGNGGSPSASAVFGGGHGPFGGLGF